MTWKRPVHLLLIGIAVVTAGCESVMEPHQLALSYEVPTTFSIAAGEPGRLALRNHGTVAVHMPMGSYVSYERWNGSDWINLGPWFIVDGFPSTIRVDPGTRVENSIHMLYFGESGPGTYRFRYEIYEDAAMKKPLPLALRVSNSFQVNP